MPSREEHRSFAGLLFTDVVGSTEIASEIGDHRWRVLLERNLAVVRGVLRGFDGQEIDTAGDGLFALFDTPGRAIRCAAAMASRVREHGLEIRSGIHSGEIERSDGFARGIAVHVAARVVSFAGPGEIVVTQTVRDVVAGSPVAFASAGHHELRGVEGEWHLFKVVELDGKSLEPRLSADEASRRRGAIAEPTPTHRRRYTAVGLAGAVIVAIAVLGLVMRNNGSNRGQQSGAAALSGSVVAVEAETGKRVRTIAHVHPGNIADLGGDAPYSDLLAVGAGAIWMYHFGFNARATLVVIDPTSGVQDRISLERSQGGRPGLVVTSQTVWLSGPGRQGEVSRLNPATNEPLPPATVLSISPTASAGSGITSITLGKRNLWVGVADGTLAGLDSLTGRIEQEIDLQATPDSLAYADGSVWVLDALEGEVVRVEIDSPTPEISARIKVPGNLTEIAAGNGGVWLLDRVAGTVTRIDPESAEPASSVQVGPTPEAIAVGLGSAWVTDDDGHVYTVDPALGPQDPIDIGAPLGAIAIDEETGDLLGGGLAVEAPLAREPGVSLGGHW